MTLYRRRNANIPGDTKMSDRWRIYDNLFT
ncbi:hypothetical protein J2S34_001857 [Nitrobacter winogradskyi]|uniref:Uncharacterized protein n=1 Tax=Nitrobacter winogradskyi TaxID=913 RepID=A0ACC6AI11_NITWI|nr:hypothetical protein [Nitrobacter winogradskyi]